MRYHHLILTIFSVCFAISVQAQEPWSSATGKVNYKDEINIPPFCRVNKPDPRYKNMDWKKKFGESFIYINHYCDSKAKMNVCYQYPKKDRDACLSRMLEGIEYAIKNASDPNYALLPLLYTDLGVVYKDIGRYAEATQSFDNAIQKNSKYIRAYGMLADTYILTKQYDEAEKTVNEGLKHKQSKALYKRLQKIADAKK